MSAHDSDTTTNSDLLAGSTIVAILRSIQETFRPRLSTLGSWAGRVIRSSLLYRWFTMEPEPEVIVIDLRRTRTVGPFIAILDRIVETLAPYFEDSQLKTGLDVLAAWISALAETRVGQLIVTLLEPPTTPDQPEEPNRTGNSKDDCDRLE
ncbi:hypothetical protein [Haloplanus rubicundus]|uniref:Uncharacterized protein n=1 Tax=Haloplanus rubicundus TaxID=1547898 RepID=A0A345EBV3_9EURY|nr:hypothetical protein [Haloplanus rubicundus]AXG09675.1 hypothetical protein DU484_07255 [Haloplanus rubicundus]